MAKSRDAFRTISEVAEWLDIQAHVLRFWESKFTQVKPIKRAGGRRYYRSQDMLLLGGIKKLLHDDGLTIKGAQKLLREEGIKHVSALSQPLDTEAEAAPQEPAKDIIDIAPEPAVEPHSDTPLFATADQVPANEETEDFTDADVASGTVEVTAAPEKEADSADDTATEANEDTAPIDATTTAPEVAAAKPNDEVLEDFVSTLRHATHIHPEQATEAAALAAQFATLFASAKETAQA